MPQISQTKKDKITEQILFHLYQVFPAQIFVAEISREIARDEEFVKELLLEMLKKDLVVRTDKNPEGIKYSRRARWRLSNRVQEAYKQQQKSTTVAKQSAESVSEQSEPGKSE